jgi:hypothetical protein
MSFISYNIVTCRVVCATKMTGSSLNDWILDLLALWLQSLLITYNRVLSLIYTHTGPLLVPQLKRRNYNSLTESHPPSITHE